MPKPVHSHIGATAFAATTVALLSAVALCWQEWRLALLAVPVLGLLYRFRRLAAPETAQRHAEEMAALHLRTIEALALAIDAKDCITHGHLRRVQVYALAVGKELGLGEPEMQALRAAAVLHDIGKLAIPDHIVSKPGRLTPEEFEKMKIHPVVGAEILGHVKFPYPVAPIVRAHHERWDGSGYPDGLKGEEIPIGARILGAVDCLDALASDRPYRPALPLDEAMQKVASEAGRSFDPCVVEILERRYKALESVARSETAEGTRLSTELRIDRGAAPAAGFEKAAEPAQPGADAPEFLDSIAAARAEAQLLYELTTELGNSLSLDETISVAAIRLKHLIPYDGIAVYVRQEDNLVPVLLNGETFRRFSSIAVPLGQGLSGWVAQNDRPILNGNPSVEPGYVRAPARSIELQSALSVPLQGLDGIIGVVTLYREHNDAFSKDHLRILSAISSKLGLSIDNALKYRRVASSDPNDAVSGLPNARSLFVHLDGELARSRRTGQPVTVLACDLDAFRQINERFGYRTGDHLLREVGRALKETCREYDYIARMGGDEFAIVIPGLNGEALRSATRRFREAAARAAALACGQAKITLSVGAAIYPADGADAEQLLAEADRRMHKAKQAARVPQTEEDLVGLAMIS